MRSPVTCVFCLLERGRQPTARSFTSAARQITAAFASKSSRSSPLFTSLIGQFTSPRISRGYIGLRAASSDSCADKDGEHGIPHNKRAKLRAQTRTKRKYSSTAKGTPPTGPAAVAGAARIRARVHAHVLLNFRSQMRTYLSSSSVPGITIEEALQGPARKYKPLGAKTTKAKLRHREAAYDNVADVLRSHYASVPYTDFAQTLDDLVKWKSSGQPVEASLLAQKPPVAALIADLGLADEKGQSLADSNDDSASTRPLIRLVGNPVVRLVKSYSNAADSESVGTQQSAPSEVQQPDTDTGSRPAAPAVSGEEDASAPAGSFQPLKDADQPITPLPTGDIQVPRLSFDLSRVLFNPGVYQLQDPRSRVYNFDPYLEKIMPVTEFNFEALNQYVTSSQDTALRDLALQRQKRYIGSSSSMTSTLAHFHFLLSAWRPLDIGNLSRAFKVESDNFTRFQRAPTAAFLRYQDGVYAMDADKEFDEATVLLSLGRSMEKLLTLEKSDYEKLRRSNAIDSGQFDLSPEQYHYSELGSFVMRSQLDAYDPRLPGTGMFDLKTRAVVAVRMTAADERGSGYEIKHRHGTWESFEREYYDMMRSAFLKYSLQVRMGRMDGVFVAYHNIARIFGFQYISLAEMDRALHGQDDKTLGDLEFRFSVNLLTEIFDRATAAFPRQSLRFHFETRESTATKSEAKPWMYVFAEPVTEEEVDRIQSSRSQEVKEAEARILSGEARNPRITPKEQSDVVAYSNAANSEFLNSLHSLKLDTAAMNDGEGKANTRILGMKLVVESRVDGRKIIRPVDLAANNRWDLSYSITEMPETQAQTRYAQCKTRRSLLFNSARDSDFAAEGYVSRLLEMSSAGAAWRKQRDALDVAKGQVVLYNSDPTHRARDEEISSRGDEETNSRGDARAYGDERAALTQSESKASSLHDEVDAIGKPGLLGRTVLHFGEAQAASANVFRKKNFFLVLTETHLVRFRSQAKAAEMFASVPATMSRTSSRMSVNSYSEMQMPAHQDMAHGIPLHSILAVYRLDDGRPFFTVEIAHCDDRTQRPSAMHMHFHEPGEADSWILAIRSAVKLARGSDAPSISQNTLDYAVRAIEKADDYDPDHFHVFRAVQKSSSKGHGRTSSDDLAKLSTSFVVLVVGLQRVHLLPLMYASEFLRPEWIRQPGLFDIPGDPDDQLPSPPCSEDDYAGFDKTLMAYAAAYDVNASRICYTVDHCAEDGPKFQLLQPAGPQPYSAAELVAVFRSLRYNESFGSVSFANIDLYPLRYLYDVYGTDIDSLTTRSGISTNLTGHHALPVLCQEVRGLALKSRKLRRLDFSGCFPGLSQGNEERESCCIPEALVPLCKKSLTNVDWIILSGVLLADTDLNFLVDAASERRCHLRALELGQCGLSVHDIDVLLSAAAAQENTMEVVDISGVQGRFSPELFQRQIGAFTHIRRLNLTRVQKTAGPEPLVPPEVLMTWRLESFHISQTTLNELTIESIAAYLRCPRSELLRELHLDQCGLSGRDLAIFFRAMTRTPGQGRRMHVSTSENRLRLGISKLSEAIKENHGPSSLTMRMLDFEKEQQFRELIEALTWNTSLQSLDISRASLPYHASTETSEALKTMFATNSTLEELDMSGEQAHLDSTRFGIGLNIALRGLEGNRTLKRLRIEHQNLGPQGASTLADVLGKNECLQEIYCEHNAINLQSFTVLVNAVEKNKTLQFLPSMDVERDRSMDRVLQEIGAMERGESLRLSKVGIKKSFTGALAVPRLGHRKAASSSSAGSTDLQDAALALSAIDEKWNVQTSRLQKYLYRNYCIVNGFPWIDEEANQVIDNRPETASSMQKAVEQELVEVKSQAKMIFRRLNRNSEQQASIDSGQYSLHYLIQDSVCFLVICDRSYPRKLAFTYLSDLAQEFTTVYPSGQYLSATLRPYAFVEFDTFIQRTKKTYQDARASSNLDKLNNELKDVTKVMTKNIEDLLYRGDSLERMGEMSGRLREDSKKYRKAAVRINWDLLLKQYGPFAGLGLFILFFLWWRFF
ncbi:hypothetical protein DV737_g2925, partial [Chaetothyriales sp. CBS 132003]